MSANAHPPLIADSKAMMVIDLWAQANPSKPYCSDSLGLDYMERDPEKTHQSMVRSRELNNTVSSMLVSNELADLEALFHIGRGSESAEDYAQVRQIMMDRHRLSTMKSHVANLMSKSRLVECLAAGAQLVDRSDLAIHLRVLRISDSSKPIGET